jgi:uncharacterized protein (TIGR02453 family)
VAKTRYFTNLTFRFLRDLAAHNERAWFQDNKRRYEAHVREPALRFIEDFSAHLRQISPHFHAGPRSLFRIHRDVRFSRDKSPYKTHTGIHFRHDASKDAHAPGFYLHLEPGSVFTGVGIWHPDGPTLRKIRTEISEQPDRWKRASRGKRFVETFELSGDRLTRPPKGFDPEHPLIEDLKRKDFIGVSGLTQRFVTAPDLPDALADVFGAGKPLMRFLCKALDVPF